MSVAEKAREVMHPSYHVDKNYVDAIEIIEEDEKVEFPLVCVAEMCKLEFEGKFTTFRCEEQVHCATTNPSWSYNPRSHYTDGKYTFGSYMLQVYLNEMRRPRRDDKKLCGEGRWIWEFMLENQGCCSWMISYTGKDDPAPLVHLIVQDYDSEEMEYYDRVRETEGTWQEVMEKRMHKRNSDSGEEL